MVCRDWSSKRQSLLRPLCSCWHRMSHRVLQKKRMVISNMRVCPEEDRWVNKYNNKNTSTLNCPTHHVLPNPTPTHPHITPPPNPHKKTPHTHTTHTKNTHLPTHTNTPTHTSPTHTPPPTPHTFTHQHTCSIYNIYSGCILSSYINTSGRGSSKGEDCCEVLHTLIRIIV